MMNRSHGEPTLDVDRARRSAHGPGNQLGRALWGVVQATLFRLSPRPLHGWRRMLLRLFGARLGPGARVYPRARIWAPWNLTMAAGSTIGDDVEVYCVAPIAIGAGTTVSQFSNLCAATHDFEDPAFALVPRAIRIGSNCWIAADVFVGPGVTIGDGAVVGARSGVFGDLPPWVVAAGTPARPIRPRTMKPAREA
jgi:putative colanic acid biosynthesis acetyltransferase WcaF